MSDERDYFDVIVRSVHRMPDCTCGITDRQHQPEAANESLPPRLPCGCPLDSGCSGWHSDTP